MELGCEPVKRATEDFVSNVVNLKLWRTRPDISPRIPYNPYSFTIGGDRLRQGP